MARYNEFLYDTVENEHQRKNLYLLEIAKLEERCSNASGKAKKSLKQELSDLKRGRSAHPYVINLDEYNTKEKTFIRQLARDRKDFKNSLDESLSPKIKWLHTYEFLSKKKETFYKKYTGLSYDAEMHYEEALIVNKQIGEIIGYLLKHEKADKEARKYGKTIIPADEKKARSELKEFKSGQKKIMKDGVASLKKKFKDRQISRKALENETNELRKKYASAVLVKSYDLPGKGNRELLKSINYQITKGYRREISVLRSNIADLRRKTPVEIERKAPLFAYLTILLPGLGQILNRQYAKSIFFFFISFFTYVMAIPYSLGYANYQGKGIAGLISLAQDGTKLDKSMIFMIEGILSVYLIIFAVVFIYLSFRDALKVEKGRIRGIRPKNWFETRTSVSEEGFPYIVSLPALVVIVFIVLVPITTAILLSFTGMDPNHQSKFPWVGFENYKLIVLGEGIAGQSFWAILGWTVVWTLAATTLAIFIGFVLAILTNNERVKGKLFFRTIYLLPWAVPAFITIMFFNIMFSPNGALTGIITNLVGAEAAIVVKNDPILTRITLIFLQGWLGSSYIFLLSTGVLQSIPGDLYEAAQIDGAKAWQKLKRITIPMVLFQTAPLLIGQYTFNFNNFSIIYLFNGGGPFNPIKYGNLAGSSDLLISYIYKLTRENDFQSIGAAITVVISLGLMLFAFIGFKNSKAFKKESDK